jgi:Domain of unknown function (DUF4261)
MLGKWFGRRLTTSTPSSSASPASGQRRPHGPLLPINYVGPAMIVMAGMDGITSTALQAQVLKRLPKMQFSDKEVADQPGQRPTALGWYGDIFAGDQLAPRMCGVHVIDNLIPFGEESFIRSAWWWPDNRAALAKGKAHAVTMMLADTLKMPPKQRIVLEMQLVAAALDLLPSAIAVIWPDADAMWPPQVFLKALDDAKGAVPMATAVSIKLGRDTQNLRADGTPKLFARTHGLHAFGLMELEWRGFDGTPVELSSHLLGIADYLVSNGPIIADGDNLGPLPNGVSKIIIKHEPSTTALGTRVYAIYPQSK